MRGVVMTLVHWEADPRASGAAVNACAASRPLESSCVFALLAHSSGWRFIRGLQVGGVRRLPIGDHVSRNDNNMDRFVLVFATTWVGPKLVTPGN